MPVGSFQKEKPPARINLFLEVQTGGAKKKVELPLRMLVMGDFLGRKVNEDLAEREIINVNKDNFEDVLRTSDLNISYNVKDKLRGEGEMKVNLTFDSMKSFSPDAVARQIPELDKLLATRNLMQDLRNRVISMADFRKQLEAVIKDEKMRKQLLDELSQVVNSEGDGAAS